MKNNIFHFGDIHWLQLKVTAMGTPPAPTYATIFYNFFKLLFLEIFGNILILYRQFIVNLLVLWKKHDEELDAEELRPFQETMQESY